MSNKLQFCISCCEETLHRIETYKGKQRNDSPVYLCTICIPETKEPIGTICIDWGKDITYKINETHCPTCGGEFDEIEYDIQCCTLCSDVEIEHD